MRTPTLVDFIDFLKDRKNLKYKHLDNSESNGFNIIYRQLFLLLIETGHYYDPLPEIYKDYKINKNSWFWFVNFHKLLRQGEFYESGRLDEILYSMIIVDKGYLEFNLIKYLKSCKNQFDENYKKQGYFEEQYSTGKLFSKGHFENNLKIGYWEYYYENDKLYLKEFYFN